jgi:hypothetical protein
MPLKATFGLSIKGLPKSKMVALAKFGSTISVYQTGLCTSLPREATGEKR